jgi:DNA-binding ferritin-like protein
MRKIAATHKIAQEESGGALKKALTDILTILRLQYLSYQNSHWQTKGTGYYGNHLLFQRLYESVESEVDTFGERIVGHVGSEALQLCGQISHMHELCEEWCKEPNLAKRGLASEMLLQKVLKEKYEALKESGELTLGLDDLIMATASNHESNIYLLKQALRKE